MPASKQASSHSVGRTPGRKSRSNAADCDKQTQPRAEFRGNKRDPYYVSYHGSYDPVNLPPKGFSGKRLSTRNQPYAKREEIPYIPSPSSGRVGPELDLSVRARNMPIIFIKQMKEKALFIRDSKGNYPYRRAFNTLYSDYNNFYVEAKNRPNIGCVPTFNWSDFQVKIWTQLAYHIGVQYSGKREYSFPKGTLGKTQGGSYYPRNVPWPRFSQPGSEGTEVLPFFDRPRTKKRSEFSRIMRSLKRIKEVVVKPFDFSSNLIVRREKSSRTIRSEWRNSGMVEPFQTYRERIPFVLGLNTRKFAKAPDIVLSSLKKIAGSTSKVLPSSPWVVPKADPIQPTYTVKVQSPPNRALVHRLRVYLSYDGNAYYTRSGNDGRVNLLLTGRDKNPDQTRIISILNHAAKIQSKIDSYYPSDPPMDECPTLGSWDSW